MTVSDSKLTRAKTPQIGPLMRKRRKARGQTLQELCAQAGLSVGYLSQVERGNAVPTLGTLAQIAAALDVGLDYFIIEHKPADALSRAKDRPHFSIAGSSIVYESISSDYPGSELTSYILHIPPGYVSETVSHEGEELLVVLDGEIIQSLGGEDFTMRPGDALHYAGTTPHSWVNPGNTTARLLWTGTLTVLRSGETRRLPRVTASPTSPK
ncbi:XRE family transcriptional regulator [Abyssibius alkaniclasticus]|uniref:helix-turn-helix domain-containing protein n=1 Tax=Abyssibius alkaniclasticus TaxID=2881234 RepID=UPI002363423D|nr:XRE family transcriptional regulator [Abyssibius alkaniclasticus]UPH71174.1 XRE family transcriptional regulator [Abyssibius alkaniclasticus]